MLKQFTSALLNPQRPNPSRARRAFSLAWLSGLFFFMLFTSALHATPIAGGGDSGGGGTGGPVQEEVVLLLLSHSLP